jgi:hypothetical protein
MGRERGREEKREGGKEGGREGGREGEREGGREGGREKEIDQGENKDFEKHQLSALVRYDMYAFSLPPSLPTWDVGLVGRPSRRFIADSSSTHINGEAALLPLWRP